MKSTIFEVDVKGFRELYSGKPKWLIVRELIANALDENITECRISFSYEGRKAIIIVEDDSPEGFLDLSDSFTLFRTTRKRSNPNVRGRFNMGEKESLCLCEYARIITTTGAVEFDMKEERRTTLRRKRDKGSEVMIVVKMTNEEYAGCIKYCSEILMPKDIKFYLDVKEGGNLLGTSSCIYKEPFKIFTSKLRTELKDKESGEMRSVTRETEVHIHDKKFTGDVSYIFELGIPICEIDCQYSVDVQQKVPLSTDRDKVDSKYLKTLYAEVLNHVFDEIKEQQSSNTWVRSAIETGNVKQDAIVAVVKERYGDKVAISNPFNPISDDEAKANGYKLIYGNELSAEERDVFKKNGTIKSSSEIFKVGGAPSTDVTPDNQHLKVFELTQRISIEFLGFKPMIRLIDCQGATFLATFGEENELTFYNNIIPKEWWSPDVDGYVSDEMLELIIHELCHKFGHHCDRTYLDKITWLASKLIRKQRKQNGFFKIK